MNYRLKGGEPTVAQEIEITGADSKSITGDFVAIDGMRLHFVSKGAGSPVIFLHGNSGSHLDFPDELIDKVARQFRVIVLDRPGHGFSERDDQRVITVEHQAELLHAFLQALQLEQPLIVGHSWGGSLALVYALMHPEDYAGAVLLAPYAFGSLEAQETFDYFLEATLPTLPVVGDVAIRLLTPLVGEWIVEEGLREAFHPESVPQDYLESAKKLWTRATQVRAYAEDEKTIDESLTRLSIQFGSINRPLVIVAGEKDGVVPHEDHAVRLHATISGSKLIVIPDAGHQIHQTRPEMVLKAIEIVWEMVEEQRLEVRG
jgi:pimeloyl-ACP methyl ester carboxylesterase